MTDVVIQVAPATVHVALNEPIVLVAVKHVFVTPRIGMQVPLVTTISIGNSSISAVPNPFIAERGAKAVAA